MNIIQVNESNNKAKYEIYKIHLNEEKARRFREEQAKKIEFYRLSYRKECDLKRYNGLELEEYIERVGKDDTQYVYEFTEVQKARNSIAYANSIDISLPGYQLNSYDERIFYSEIFKEAYKKGIAQQESFIEQFMENGLSNYEFKHIGKIIRPIHGYIFLNSLDYRSQHSSYSCCENVVSLPNEIMAMYLLEKGMLEEAFYYINKIMGLEEENKLFSNFEFEKSSSFSQKQIDDLMDCGVIDEKEFTRKLTFDEFHVSYIKNRQI